MKIDEYGMPVTGGSGGGGGGGGGGADVSGVTATAADVSADKKFVTVNGELVDGTLATVTEPAPTLSLNSSTGVVTASYTPVAGQVKDTTAKSGTLQLTTQGATTITPGSSAQVIPAGKFLTGDITVAAVTPSGGGNTVLLMHFDNSLEREGLLADGGIITERIHSMDAEMGGSGENWTPTFDTGKFGNAILLDGSNQSGDEEWEEWYNHKLTLPVSADLLTDDFTVEFWYKTIAGYDNAGGILDATANRIIYFGARGGDNPQVIDIEIGNGTSSSSSFNVRATPGVWHHVAFVRNNDTCIVYIDGQQVYSHDVSSLSSMTQNALLCLGCMGNRFYGLIDELRISNIARYTAAFTPPTAPFTVD